MIIKEIKKFIFILNEFFKGYLIKGNLSRIEEKQFLLTMKNLLIKTKKKIPSNLQIINKKKT